MESYDYPADCMGLWSGPNSGFDFARFFANRCRTCHGLAAKYGSGFRLVLGSSD